jgi:hypothetical protein
VVPNTPKKIDFDFVMCGNVGYEIFDMILIQISQISETDRYDHEAHRTFG